VNNQWAIPKTLTLTVIGYLIIVYNLCGNRGQSFNKSQAKPKRLARFIQRRHTGIKLLDLITPNTFRYCYNTLSPHVQFLRSRAEEVRNTNKLLRYTMARRGGHERQHLHVWMGSEVSAVDSNIYLNETWRKEIVKCFLSNLLFP